ncbi:MAG TPA: haloacid dehalogenase type II [Hanamia sp.]|nr:haloacid dehalogenase type II [Hanamia sp.]
MKSQLLASVHWNGSKRPVLLIFDVNETLIDYESLNPLFARLFGDKRVMREWLGYLEMYSMTLKLSGYYKDYWTLGGGIFQMVGAIHGINITEEHVEALKEGMKTMPAHLDAEEGLKRLRDAGYRMVTLNNSPAIKNRKSPLESAGLSKYFERQFNMESSCAYKPCSIVYHMVADAMNLAPEQCCMVTTHVWDAIGAQSAGLSSGLITRRGNAPLLIPGLPHPNIIAKDILTFSGGMAGL